VTIYMAINGEYN